MPWTRTPSGVKLSCSTLAENVLGAAALQSAASAWTVGAVELLGAPYALAVDRYAAHKNQGASVM